MSMDDDDEPPMDRYEAALESLEDCLALDEIDNQRAIEMIEAMYDIADWMLDNGNDLTPNVHFALNQIFAAYALAASGPRRKPPFEKFTVVGGADHRQSEQSEDWPWPS